VAIVAKVALPSAPFVSYSPFSKCVLSFSSNFSKIVENHRCTAVMKLDRIDKRILAAMQANARITNLELAEKVGLSPTPCARRVKQLEDAGIIERHVTLLNQQKLGLNITAMIGISMDRHTPERFENFEREVRQYPEVIECSIVTGQSADYLLKAVLPDMTYYEEFLLGRLTRIEGVTGVHSSFVLRKVIARTELPLEHIK
jgi:Lrp/AsnC family leucine-responsive transcriptional regulator